MRMIPLLAFAIALYAVASFLAAPLLSGAPISATLPSGAVWGFNLGDVIVAVGSCCCSWRS